MNFSRELEDKIKLFDQENGKLKTNVKLAQGNMSDLIVKTEKATGTFE